MIYTIYKISIAGEDYIGSTKDLKQRKRGHKSNSNNSNRSDYNCKLYTTIRDNGGWDCCVVAPVEEYECESKRQAECREEYWRREYKAMLNTNKAFTTKDERKLQIEKGNKKHKEQPYIICECGGTYQSCNKGQHLKSKRHQKFINQDGTPLL